MDVTADYPSSPYLSNVDASKSALEGNLWKLFWKVPKYVLLGSIFEHSHSVPVVFIGTFLAADKLFPDCRHPGVFVNVIASNCCLYGEFKTCYFV